MGLHLEGKLLSKYYYWALMLDHVVVSLPDGETAIMPDAFSNPIFIISAISATVRAWLKIATSSMLPAKLVAPTAGAATLKNPSPVLKFPT